MKITKSRLKEVVRAQTMRFLTEMASYDVDETVYVSLTDLEVGMADVKVKISKMNDMDMPPEGMQIDILSIDVSGQEMSLEDLVVSENALLSIAGEPPITEEDIEDKVRREIETTGERDPFDIY